jgi:hypothetical protein
VPRPRLSRGSVHIVGGFGDSVKEFLGLHKNVHRLGLSGLHAWCLSIRLETAPVDVMPQCAVLLLVVAAYIISPPCRLHEQHKAVIGDGNILKPRLPLVRVPGMFFQHCLHLLDGRRVLLLEDLVSNDPREHIAGDVPGRSGKGRYGKRENTRDASRDTVASYAISDEQRARKKALDNRQ